MRLNPLVKEQMEEFMKTLGISDPTKADASRLADFATAMSDGSPSEIQTFLDCRNIHDRLSLSLSLLKRELTNAQLQNVISQELDSKIGDADRQEFLKSKLSSIQQELNIPADLHSALVEKLEGRMKACKLPAHVAAVFAEVGLTVLSGVYCSVLSEFEYFWRVFRDCGFALMAI